MSESPVLALSWVAGLGLGAMFFGGLWWTLRKALVSARPALWIVGGLAVRMSLALAGFYLISGGHWQRLLICLLGFVVARAGVTWLTRPSVDDSREAGQVHNAS